MALPPNPFGLSTERQDSHAVPRPQWGCSPRRCTSACCSVSDLWWNF